MARTPFTLAETAAKAFLRQAFFRKIKDNDEDHESRIVQIENAAKVFEHFNEDDGGGFSFIPFEYDIGSSAPGGWTGKWFVNRRGMYQGFDGTTRDGTIYNAAKPDPSVARVASIGALSLRYANYYTLFSVRFDQVTLPIVYQARCKFAADNPFAFGLRQGPFSERISFGGGGSDRNGIWLERVDATNWRFVAYDGSRQNGSNFTKPVAGNWFQVRIEFSNTPSNQALCYVDGVLKETLAAHLPTTTSLRGALLVADVNLGGTSGTVDYDRIETSVLSVADAA